MRFLLTALAAVTAWLAAFFSGAWPWLGYASYTRSSFGAGGLAIVGESKRGLDIGPETFLFLAGQEIVVEYDTEIRQGSLWLHVFEPYDFQLGDGPSNYITTTGHGVWTMPITKTAIYHVTIEPTASHGKPGGWDLDYTVKWGARSRR